MGFVPRFYHSQEVVDYCVKALTSKQLTALELAALFDVTDTTIYRWAMGQSRTGFEPNRNLTFCEQAAKHVSQECLLWPYAKDKDGYGKLMIDRKDLRAHQVVCEMVHGPAVQAYTFVLHLCDTPSCVNPTHLKWGTAGDNAQDRDQKGRANTAKGLELGQTKLTPSQIFEIRQIAKPGNFRQLACEYGVSRQCIAHVYHRRSWAWLG